VGVPAIEIALPGQTEVDALAVPLAQPLDSLSGEAAGALGDELRGRLGRLAASGELRGDRGEALLLHLDGELSAPRLVAAGLGKRDEIDLDAFRTAGAMTARSLARIGGSVCWLLDERLPISVPEQARALIEGTILGGYTPGQWKTQQLEKRPHPIERIVLGHVETPELRAAAERAALVAERTNRARDLANMPPNELNPGALAGHAQALATSTST